VPLILGGDIFEPLSDSEWHIVRKGSVAIRMPKFVDSDSIEPGHFLADLGLDKRSTVAEPRSSAIARSIEKAAPWYSRTMGYPNTLK